MIAFSSLRSRRASRSAWTNLGSLRVVLPAFCLLLLALGHEASGQNVIQTVTGGGTVNRDPHQADLPGPTAAVMDAGGNLYVAAPFSQYVFQMSAAKVVTQFAGLGYVAFHDLPGPANTEPLSNPSGVAVDNKGNIYIADTGNNTIRKVDTNGVLQTFAGTSKPCPHGKCGDGALATKARLNAPQGVAVDSKGNVYIADTGDDRIRVVQASTGKILRFAGLWNVSCSDPTTPCGDGGAANAASLRAPMAVAVDKQNNVYIADSGDNRVRVVGSKSKIINALAGNGTTCAPSTGICGDGASALSARMGPPRGVAVDQTGNVYIADTRDNRIRLVSTGIISTFAGSGVHGFAGDGGAPTSAQLASPNGVSVDNSGTVYISDTGSQRIRAVLGGVINTVFGGGDGGDGGSAVDSQLANPYSVAVDSSNNYYIVDTNNNRVRFVTNETITTVAGSGNSDYTGDGGPATFATLNGPQGVALDGVGNLFIADSGNAVVRVVSSGVITTFAGTGHPCPAKAPCGDGGPATDAWLTSPSALALDQAGNLYIADPKTERIRKITNGIITTVAGTGDQGYSGDGGPATSAFLSGPTGVAVDSQGNLYIADAGNNRVRCVLGAVGGCGDTQNKHTVGDIIRYAFDGSETFQGDGGLAAKASRWNPTQLAVDTRGNLFIGGGNDELIQRVDLDTGIIVTVAGDDRKWWFYGFKGDGNRATRAQIDNAGLAISGNEDLFIADAGNNRIREVAHLVPVAGLTPTTLDFGSVTVGDTSPPQTVTLQNTGSDDLAISDISTTGDFSQSNNCPSGSATLAPSVSCTITVVFTPTKKGKQTGSLQITDNAPNSPQQVKLKGTGL